MSPHPPERAAAMSRGGMAALVLPIFAASLAAYLPAIQCGLVWNDSDYVTRADLQSLNGLRRIWFEVGATEQYYPLLHSAFWVEHRLWGDAAVGYHAVNILLHALSACLFVVILRRLWGRAGGPPPPFDAALFGGLIFALHPVCVESVAWISEQKNTLSTVFYLGAALTYLRFDAGSEIPDADPALPGGRRPLSYLGATILFALALLTKTVAATLPAALLIILWWKRSRLDWRRDVLPLAPWFILGAASGLFSAWVEKRYLGAEGTAFTLAFTGRFLLAGRAIWFYLGKFLWPHPLVFIYPRWQVEAGAWWQYLFPCGVLALAAGCWAARQRTRAPLAAFLLLVVALAPTLGFFNVYGFLFSYVADHWAYLAILPLAAVAAAAWGKGCGRSVLAPRAAAVAILGACTVLTWRQVRVYRDEATLYRTILKLNPAAWLAHSNLGILLAATGRLPEAIAEYKDALRLSPENAQAHNNLGNAFNQTGQTAEAIGQYRQALRLEPRFAEAVSAPRWNGSIWLRKRSTNTGRPCGSRLIWRTPTTISATPCSAVGSRPRPSSSIGRRCESPPKSLKFTATWQLPSIAAGGRARPLSNSRLLCESIRAMSRRAEDWNGPDGRPMNDGDGSLIDLAEIRGLRNKIYAHDF